MNEKTILLVLSCYPSPVEDSDLSEMGNIISNEERARYSSGETV
jgi:hypothetical protein